MRELGLRGVVRGRRFRTTVADQDAVRAPDRVARDFTAISPGLRWVVDFTTYRPSKTLGWKTSP